MGKRKKMIVSQRTIKKERISGALKLNSEDKDVMAEKEEVSPSANFLTLHTGLKVILFSP